MSRRKAGRILWRFVRTAERELCYACIRAMEWQAFGTELTDVPSGWLTVERQQRHFQHSPWR